MRVSSTALISTLLLTASAASAAGGHGTRRGHKDRSASLRRAGTGAHERFLAERAAAEAASSKRRRSSEKRCKVKSSANSFVAATTTSSSSSAAPVETSSAWEEPAAPSTTNIALAVKPTSQAKEWVAPTTSTTEEWIAPTTSSKEKWVAPTTSTTEEWVAPTTSAESKWVAPTTTSSSAAATATPDSEGIVGGVLGKLLSITDSTCGWSGAQAHSNDDAGPNGAIDWLNCGIDGGGWTPPSITLDELVYADLGTVLASGSSPFGPCAAYQDMFKQIGEETNVPPIMVAAFAMQESTCNPNAVGGGGEQGMFQISQDKCGNAPGGNCQEPWYNARTAMKYFKSQIDSLGLLAGLGQYNGWTKGMTYSSATAAANGPCCRCQNNLDYAHQFLNGWLQGIDGHSIGRYWNLNVCG